MNKKKIVIDANVFISYLVYGGDTMNKVFSIATNNHLILMSNFLSKNILDAYSRKWFMTVEQMVDLIFDTLSIYQDIPFNYNSPKAIIRDEEDKPILNTAFYMNADIVISGDKDFFEIKYPGLEVLTPKQFIEKYSM